MQKCSPVRKTFHIIGFLEAISYLLLLFVAMPLKYVWDLPIYVRWTGIAHGGLFVAFCVIAVVCAVLEKWPLKWLALALLSSLVPFGPFLFEKKVLDAS